MNIIDISLIRTEIKAQDFQSMGDQWIRQFVFSNSNSTLTEPSTLLIKNKAETEAQLKNARLIFSSVVQRNSSDIYKNGVNVFMGEEYELVSSEYKSLGPFNHPRSRPFEGLVNIGLAIFEAPTDSEEEQELILACFTQEVQKPHAVNPKIIRLTGEKIALLSGLSSFFTDMDKLLPVLIPQADTMNKEEIEALLVKELVEEKKGLFFYERDFLRLDEEVHDLINGFNAYLCVMDATIEVNIKFFKGVKEDDLENAEYDSFEVLVDYPEVTDTKDRIKLENAVQYVDPKEIFEAALEHQKHQMA